MPSAVAAFQKTLPPDKKRNSFLITLEKTLAFVRDYPESIPHIGIFRTKDNAIIYNCSTYSRFLNIGSNGLNKNFNRRGIKRVANYDSTPDLREQAQEQIGQVRKWAKRVPPPIAPVSHSEVNGDESADTLPITVPMMPPANNSPMGVTEWASTQEGDWCDEIDAEFNDE
jgi:hypothetical protein